MKNWTVTFEKFLDDDEVKALRKSLEGAMILGKAKGWQIPVRDYTIIELILGTGLRVSEVSALKVDDLNLKRGQNSLIVRKGKGGRTRTVRFSAKLAKIVTEWLQYRSKNSEYLFPSQIQDQMTSRALQRVFKVRAKRAGLAGNYSIHCLRHTYATRLYRSSGYNLRLVQVQLGHISINTTSVYSAVISPDLDKAVEALDDESE